MLGKVRLGPGISVDLDVLLRTRMLIQANSGSGKSYAIRKLLEESQGVQQIVLDPEGEFSTLREKYDYILVGKGGDIPANVKTSGILAERLLQLGASAIIDLYELKHQDRIQFVKQFLNAMMNADKKLWHPCLVVVDEAHLFCPEKGEADSFSAVIDLCTRGRKRSFCAVLATQRLSKLNKDAAAECNNKLIGRTGLDIDMKRAGEELGFAARQVEQILRNLAPGSFFAFGPAISEEVTQVRIGTVKTSHPDVGTKAVVVPAAPAKIRKVLASLVDLTVEAEKKEKDLADFAKENRELKERLRELSKTKPSHVDVDTKQLVKVTTEKLNSDWNFRMVSELNKLKEKVAGELSRIVEKTLAKDQVKRVDPAPPPIKIKGLYPYKAEAVENISTPAEIDDDKPLGKCAHKIMSFLTANVHRSWTKAQVGIMTGYSQRSSSFIGALSTLTTRGMIARENGKLRSRKSDYTNDLQLSFNIDNIKATLGKCEREILEIVIDRVGETVSKEELASSTPSGYSATSSSFIGATSKLTQLGLLTRVSGKIRLSDDATELL